MVSASQAAACVSTAEEAPAPESKQVSESLPHHGEQPNPGGPRVEVGVGVRTAVRAVTLLSQELSLVVLAHNWAVTTFWPEMSVGTMIICH